MYHSVAPTNELRHFADQDIIFAVELYICIVTKALPMVILEVPVGKKTIKVCTYRPFKTHPAFYTALPLQTTMEKNIQVNSSKLLRILLIRDLPLLS